MEVLIRKAHTLMGVLVKVLSEIPYIFQELGKPPFIQSDWCTTVDFTFWYIRMDRPVPFHKSTVSSYLPRNAMRKTLKTVNSPF